LLKKILQYEAILARVSSSTELGPDKLEEVKKMMTKFLKPDGTNKTVLRSFTNWSAGNRVEYGLTDNELRSFFNKPRCLGCLVQ